jgi:hypothetical protein
MTLKNRTDLKSYFVKNAIPTEGNFADLIDSQINQTQDGVFKPDGEPLSVVAAAPDQKRVLRLYSTYPSANPDWFISLNPAQDPANVAGTMKPGFGITDGTGKTRLFVDKTSGQIGIGTNAPQAALDVAGSVRASAGLTVESLIDVTATATTTNGWYEAIRLSRAEHSAITHPGGKLLFGLHGDHHFYWVNMANGANVMSLDAPTGNLTITGGITATGYTIHGYGMLTDGPNENYNCHFPHSSNDSYISGNRIFLRGGRPNGYNTILTATASDSSVAVAGPLNVGGVSTLSKGAKLGAMCIGGSNAYGNVTWPYETIQMDPANNFRIWYGTKERFRVENTGQVVISFDGGYWAFQPDGNLVKYTYAGRALWALNLSNGPAGWS